MTSFLGVSASGILLGHLCSSPLRCLNPVHINKGGKLCRQKLQPSPPNFGATRYESKTVVV